MCCCGKVLGQALLPPCKTQILSNPAGGGGVHVSLPLQPLSSSAFCMQARPVIFHCGVGGWPPFTPPPWGVHAPADTVGAGILAPIGPLGITWQLADWATVMGPAIMQVASP